MVLSRMAGVKTEKISVSLPKDLIRYAEDYQRQHGVGSRSEVMVRALEALREAELIESYKQHALENPDPLLEMGTSEGLQPSHEDDW